MSVDVHMGMGGPDDNAAQAGHLVVEQRTYADTGEGHQTYIETRAAVALRDGSGGGGAKAANLVVEQQVYQSTGAGAERPGSPSLAASDDNGSNQVIVCPLPIDMRQASRGEKMTNNRKDGSTGGAPGTDAGAWGDPSPTLADSHTPAVVYPIQDARPLVKHQGGMGVGKDGDPSYVLDTISQHADGVLTDVRCVTGEYTHALTASACGSVTEDGTGRGTPTATMGVPLPVPQSLIAFAQNQRDEVRDLGAEAGCLAAQPGMKQQTCVAYNIVGTAQHSKSHAYETENSLCLQHKGCCPTGNEAATVAMIKGAAIGRSPSAVPQRGEVLDDGTSYTVTTNETHAVAHGMIVRRLTPVECLRLQGLPDDYLDLDPPLSDSAKYRLIGNAGVVACVQWILDRLRVALEIIAAEEGASGHVSADTLQAIADGLPSPQAWYDQDDKPF